jgi:hypothetical protein
MTPGIRGNFYFVTSILIFGVFSVILLYGGIPRMIGAMFVDDTFYYLQPAWMLKTNGLVSFDGLHETNGVQFLWFVICSLLAFLSVSKTVLVYLAATVTCAIAGAVYFAIWRVSRRFAGGASLFAAPACVVWTFAVLDLHTRELGGLEAALQSLALWFSLLAFLNMSARLKKGTLPRQELLTYVASLVLLVYCRLDAAFCALCLGTGALWQIYRLNQGSIKALLRTEATTIALAGLLVIAGAFIEFLFFYRTGGTLLPVSAIAKVITAQQRGYELSPYAIFIPFQIVMEFLLSHIGTRASSALSIAAFAAAAITPHLMPVLRRRAPHLLQFHAAFAVGIVIYSLAVNHQLGRIQVWYLSPIIFFYAVAIAAVFWGYFVTDPSRGPLVFHSTLAGFLLLGVFAGTLRVVHASPSYLNRLEVAFWINKNLPANARIGSFNAGELGYFSNRIVVNLDGLINNVEYARGILFHSDKLAAYFLSNRIDYFADHDTYWADDLIKLDSCPIYIRYRPAEEFPPLVVRRWTGEPDKGQGTRCQTAAVVDGPS